MYAFNAWWGFSNANDRHKTFAFIRRCIHTGFCSPDLADFHNLYISSDEKLFNQILTCYVMFSGVVLKIKVGIIMLQAYVDEAPKARGSRRRKRWGVSVPLHTRGRGCALHNFFPFGSQNGDFGAFWVVFLLMSCLFTAYNTSCQSVSPIRRQF